MTPLDPLRDATGRVPKPPSSTLENARAVVEAEESAAQSIQSQRGRRLWRAIVLATSLEVVEALLRGESVPLGRLDPEWVARLGRREQ